MSDAGHFIPYEAVAKEAERRHLTLRHLLERCSRTGDYRPINSVRAMLEEDDTRERKLEASDKKRFVEAD